jgi:adenine deaminase
MNPEQLRELSRSLVEVAMGRRPADLVVRAGRWACVQTGELLEGTDVAVLGERIAYVGPDASHCIGKRTQVIQAEGRYLVPGLLDGHMHIESGMVTITEFVRAVLPRGTTGIFVDPHEIANVLGLEGVRLMVEEAAAQPMHVWVQMPSCVPSAPGLETAGANIGPEEVAQAMGWPGIIGLGEMMNFPAVAAGDPAMHQELAETRAAGKVIGGHYASSDLSRPFHAYAAAGAEDDHEGTRLEDALARARQGMKVMLRLGSAWHDVAAQLPAVTELGLDSRHFILVTDDSHSGTLIHEGHMDRVVRHAVQLGADPMVALQMATLNTAEHFGVSRQVGQIAPGRFADLLLAEDLRQLHADLVIARGKLVAQDGELAIDLPEFRYPARVRASVHLGRALAAADFAVASDGPKPQTVQVIGVVENQAPTRRLTFEMQPVDGRLGADLARDLAKVALLERHRGTGQVQVGFVHGFGFDQACAVGSTVAHDSHQMLVVGTDDASMALAANRLAEVGGGLIVVRDGRVAALVELPIAGLMSDERADVVARKAEAVLQAFRECGCRLNNANMQLSLLALVVIPELRISDKGLVDVDRFEVVPLRVKPS